MKKLIVLSLVLAIALTACGATTPTEAPVVEPTVVPPTAEVIVVTVEVPVEVEVTVEPTMAEPTPMPTATLPPPPEPTQIPPTAAVPADSDISSDISKGPFVVNSSLWSPFFKDITYSGESFSLRCYPGDIVFTAVATNPYIVDVELYYRIEDRQSTYITEWRNSGKMDSIGDGKFSMKFSGGDVHPDLRKKLAWFDFQLIGLNKQADVVGRTEKILQLVTYTIDCP